MTNLLILMENDNILAVLFPPLMLSMELRQYNGSEKKRKIYPMTVGE